MNCPKCQAVAEEDSNFCEECGTPLRASPVIAEPKPDSCACGAGEDKIDEDGFCQVCGMQRRNAARDHVELELSPLAGGVSDIGKRHSQNEDAFRIHQEMDCLIAVVCDGVSVSQSPEKASAAAADAGKEALAESARKADADPRQEMREALKKADAAVKQVGFIPNLDDIDPPSSTIVAVMIMPPGSPGTPKKAIIGWVGDSRVYYFTNKANTLLTTDHSWANEAVQAGEMTYEQAMKDKRSHRLTRTLGGYAEKPGTEMDEPGIVEVELSATGWLIVCTDGIWNYADSAEEMGKVFQEIPKTATALEIARHMTDWANKQGGKDNVSAVALAV